MRAAEVQGGLGADMVGLGGQPLLPGLWRVFSVDEGGWGSPLLEGEAGLC